jgi:valyl-tRNA synthetase
VIDPLQIMDEYGTDALRFTLAAMASPGRDIKLSQERIEGYRNFANKIWNAARFALMNLPQDFLPDDAPSGSYGISPANEWIRSRLNLTTYSVNDSLRAYRFDEAAGILYQFIWHEFCDWYLELIKVDLADDDDRVRNETYQTMAFSFDKILRLLHPFMPFITEEIWQRLPHEGKSIMIADFPHYDEGLSDEEALRDMDLVMRTIGGIRNIRGEMDIAPNKRLDVLLLAEEDDIRDGLEQYRAYITDLARVRSLSFITSGEKPQDVATAVIGDVEIFVAMARDMDLEGEARRLEKEIRKVEKDMEIVARKLSNDEFISKAPAEVVEKVKAKREALLIREKKLRGSLGEILKIQQSAPAEEGRRAGG